MKKLLSFTILLSFVLLHSCGGGGGGGGGDINVGEKISVTGTLSDIVVSLKPGNVSGPRMAVSDWSGATVKVINSSGAVLGSNTANSDGSYTISNVTSGSNYVVRASTGNLIMKAFIADATADKSGVIVDPTSTAIVMVLASMLEKDNLGDEDVDYSTEIDVIDSSSTVSSISSNSLITDVASAIESDIASSYVAADTTASVGSAGTAGDTTAASIGQVTPTSTTDIIGTWVLTTMNDEAVNFTNTITYSNDGTYTSGTSNCTESGTWSTSGDQMTFTVTAVSGADCWSVVGGSNTVTYSVTSTTFTMSGTYQDSPFTNVSTRLDTTIAGHDSNLVGTWKISSSLGQAMTIDFSVTLNADGTYSTGGTAIDCAEIGTWSTSGNNFTATVTSATGGDCSMLFADTGTVPYTVNTTTFTYYFTYQDSMQSNVYTRQQV